MHGTLAERFWAKVNKTDICWLWTASLSTHGYGQIGVGRRIQRAHRVAWFLTFGTWPTDKVCHRCDNPLCVKPDHLFLGTQADNLKDMRDKGRGRLPPPSPRGEANNKTSFTTADVRIIRERYAQGDSLRTLGRAYGVWHTTISDVVHRRTWAHIT